MELSATRCGDTSALDVFKSRVDRFMEENTSTDVCMHTRMPAHCRGRWRRGRGKGKTIPRKGDRKCVFLLSCLCPLSPPQMQNIPVEKSPQPSCSRAVSYLFTQYGISLWNSLPQVVLMASA